MSKMNCIFALVLGLFCFSGIADEAVNLDGSWSFHTWKGYLPHPQMQSVDNVVSIREVKGEYGFALQSSKKLEAKAGDTVTFQAKVKGEDTISLRLHNLDIQGRWISVSEKSAKTALTPEWQDISLTVKVDNIGNKMTEKVLITLVCPKGSELDITNAQVQVFHTDYVGDALFPRVWKAFPGVPNAEMPPVDVIPETIAGISGKSVKLDDNVISFASMFPVHKLRNCAWIYGSIVARAPGEYTVGAGADYFMAVYVNGKKIIDTLQSGDDADTPHFTNHIGKALLHTGDNIIAVKFETGTSNKPFISIGGAEDLSNLNQAIRVSEKIDSDDFESKRERAGNPSLVKRIFTEGMDNLTTQAIYQNGSSISFTGKKYELPIKSCGKFFVTGVRLYQFDGVGSMDFHIGDELVLSVERKGTADDLTMNLKRNGQKLNGAILPLDMLPADLLFSVNQQKYNINAVSIQNSKQIAFSGLADFSKLEQFATYLQFNTASVRIDDYFVGLGTPENKSNLIPFKVDLAPTFDPVKAGWKMIFQDEFDGKEIDWKKRWTTAPWSRESDKNKDTVSIKDGMARFTCEWYKDNNGKLCARNISLYSRERFSYGYYEAKVRFTRKPGCWAAFWMHDEGRNMQLGGGYEIDIFEDYPTRSGKPTVASNLHASRGSHQNSFGYHINLPKTLDDFYLIGCKWTPFEISTYVDGKLVKSVSRHSPWQSVTYDAINHGFGTSKLYICVGICFGTTGGKGVPGEQEEFLVDWVRGYEYPMEKNPVVSWSKVPEKSTFKTGELFTLEAKSSIEGTAYLFDNGSLIDYKSQAPYQFSIAVDEKHYKDTVWAQAGRSGKKMTLDRYPHIYRIAVQDKEGRVGFTEIFPVIVDMQYGEPFNGASQSVPGDVNPAQYNTGGHNVSCYKQNFSPLQDGKEYFSRKKLGLREAGEYVNIAFNVTEDGTYKIIMPRRPYPEDLRWHTRALVLIDGKYVGDLKAASQTKEATLEQVVLKKGAHNMTLISACNYGVWPDAISFVKK